MRRPIVNVSVAMPRSQSRISLNRFSIHRAQVEIETRLGYSSVRTRMSVPDVQTGMIREVGFGMPIDDFRLNAELGDYDEAEVARAGVINAVIHEVDEHLTWNGHRRWDPHQGMPEGHAKPSSFAPESHVLALEAEVRRLRREVAAYQSLNLTAYDLDRVRQIARNE